VPRSLIVVADGGSRGNPGPAGYGAAVLDAATGEVLAEVRASIGTATNNVAEYRGLIAGLEEAARIMPGAPVEVRMDSKLVVEQMSDRWKIKHPDLRPLAQSAAAVAARLGRVTYTWVPRERNAHADRLANEAMDAAAGESEGTGSGLDRTGEKIVPVTQTAWRPAGQQPVTTVLLRHGQTPLSIERRFAGTVDVPLTEIGLGQAQAAAAQLAGRSVDAVVTSPLGRARRTADEVVAATGAPVSVEDGLRETAFGKWEGLSFAEAQQQWPDEMAAWLADHTSPPPGGESFPEVSARVGAAVDNLLVSAQPGQVVVVVSHVTPIKMIVARALLAPVPAAVFRMHLDVASICEIDWYADGGAVLRSFNDTAHLRAG
jgi:probable phosphoglycerate mutase